MLVGLYPRERRETKAVFVLASNYFQKCFSINAGVWLRMENKFSRKYFQLTVMALTWKLVSVKIFTSNHFRTHAQRERESADRTGLVDRSTAPITPDRTGLVNRSTTLIAPRQSSKDRLQCRSISPPPHDLAFASAAQSHL